MERLRVLLVVLVAGVLTAGLSVDAASAGLSVDAASAGAVRSEDPPDVWTWPLSPQPDVVAGFAPPANPYGPGHRGVDLLGWPGQPVVSVAAGTVSFAGQVAGRPVIVIVHGAERSTYQPVLTAVRRGDQVNAGQLVGTLSNLGSHCLPQTCLHLGRVAGEIYLDPLELLGGGPVRLLPRHGGSLPLTVPSLPRPVRMPHQSWAAMTAVLPLGPPTVLGLLSLLQPHLSQPDESG